MPLNVALPSLSTEELFRFPVLDSRQKVFCWYIQTNPVLQAVSPSLHKVSSSPGNRFLHYGPAALKCTESACCSGEKKIQTCRRNSDGLGSGISGAHPACKGHLSPLFPIYFCRYLSLTWGCYCLHKFKNIFLSAGSEASPHAPHKFLLAL